MKRATRGLLSFASAFLIVFSTFGNAFLVAEASEPTAISETVTAETTATDIVGEAQTATVVDSKEAATEEVAGDDASKKAEENNEAGTYPVVETKTEPAKGESQDVSGTTDVNTDLVVTATEENGYVILSCGVEGSTIYYSFNEDGKNGFEKYVDKIQLDTSKDIVIWAYASYDSESMDAVDGEKVKFEYKAAEAVEDSKAAVGLRAASSEANKVGTLVTELADGDQVIAVIVSGDLNKAMTATPAGSKLAAVDLTIEDGTIKDFQNAVALTVVKDGELFYFKDADGKYLSTPGQFTQGLVFADFSEASKWKVAAKNNGFNVTSNYTQYQNTDGTFQSIALGSANKVKVFSVLTKPAEVKFYYAPESAPVAVSVAAPTASVESGSKVEFGSKVELSCATEGAKIMYSLDGKEFKSYESALEITKDVTLSAYAELDDIKSDRAEFKYEVLAGTKITDVTKLEDDQEFVLVFGDTTDSIKALSTTASAADKNGITKLKSVTVKFNKDNQLTYTNENAVPAALKAVKADEGDQYYITADFTESDKTTTKYLTTLKAGGSFTFEEQPNEFSLWFFEVSEDGTFQIKSVNGEFVKNGKTSPEYVEYYNDLFTVYSLKDGADKSPYTFSAYTMPELEETETPVEEEKLGVKVTDITKLFNGAEFSLVYNKEKVLTSAVSGKKLAGADATFNADEKLVYTDNYATLKLEKSDVEDQYYIVSGSKYLTCPATGSGLSFAEAKDDYCLWTIEDQGEGNLYIKNTKAAHSNKPQYVEFYSDFTTYGFNESKKADYTFTAYAFTDGEAVNEKGGVKFTDLTNLYEGQEFVITFNNEKALSTTANGQKLEGEDVKLNEEGRLTYTDESATIATLKLVKGEVEGQYYVVSETKDGENVTTKYLTSGATGSSLTFETEKNEYSLWTFEPEEDGSFMLKNVNAVYKEKHQYVEFFKDLFTVYGYTAGGAKDNYLFTAYTYPELVEQTQAEEPANTVGTLLKRNFYDGDKVVVYYPNEKKVMTGEINNGKLKEKDLSLSEDGTLETKDSGALVLTSHIDENGNLSFTTDDNKYLTIDLVEKESNGKTKTYANLAFADVISDNSLWTQVASDDKNEGNYYLKNVNAKVGSSLQALEYYSGFSAYGFKEDPIYVFNFYVLKEGEKVVNLECDKDTSLAVAQWAGNAHYNEVEGANEYINGDLYATNDMLDKNAKFTAVVNGNVSKPWTSATSSTTKSTSYYMGSTGVAAETDYMELSFPSTGYGNMNLSFRMRASNTAAGAFQLQYSTDGENFKNFKKGTYSYKYTAYKNSGKVDEDGKAIMEPFEVSGSGDITDGIAKTSLAPTYYVTFTFDIPNAAANSENLKIRLVPTGGLSAKGDKAPANGGVIRMDSVKVTGNPVVDSSVTSYVKADPVSGEVPVGQKVSLSSDTEGAEIYYSVNGGEFVKYDDEAKAELTELPATISAYAIKEGLSKSITVNYQYTQAQVAAVKASPNGGPVFEGQFVSLKTATEGAHILYRYKTAEEIAESEKSETSVETDKTTETTGTTSETTEATTEAATETADATEAEEEEHNDWRLYSGSIKLENLPCDMQVKAVLDGYKESPVTTLKFTKRLNDKYNIYFGQIHAHTNISDGAGSLEDALKHASNVDNLDYIVITDHSNSIDNEKDSKITENVDKSANDEWTYAHNLVKEYTTDDFTCAYGYEMTWSNGLGHINTYNTPGFQSRTQTEYSTYATALQNYYAALRTVPDSISQFNHPGTTFGDFQDFSYYTEENDALITMIEVGNGEGTIGSSGYFPSYEYYTRALDKGWHVAPTNNQDNHKGKWGDANTARTVMLADTNDEGAIYDAMRNYRIYATEDNDLSIYYTLEGNIMGSILEKDAVGEYLKLKADIVDPTDSYIGRVEVIVNGGQCIAQETVRKNEATVEFTVPSVYSYYYLKITEDDGDIAVTAPVWVGEVESCGINKTYTNTVLPVKGESLDINVELYNNESAPLDIDFIDIVVKDVDGKETVVTAISGEEAGVTQVASEATATYSTEFVYNEAGQVTYEVTVRATLNGVAKMYTDKLQINYTVPEMVADVIIDGSHYNDYVTGYYGGNVNEFIKLCAQKNIRATVVKDEITKETLEGSKLLVVSAPAKKTGTANAGDYKVSHYSDEFISVVKDYVAGGGTVAVCGLADYSDTTSCQTATEQNKLLEAIGATIRMGSDEVVDDTNNGGQVYRMYPTVVNLDSELLNGFKQGQKYSQYSGCSVDISNATANDVVDEAEWLVKGFETTYSVDCKDASGNAVSGVLDNGVKGAKNDNDGNVTFLARQKTKAGGQIIVAGGVFLSDFEVKAEMDNNDSLPYVNYTIVNNILDNSTVELPTSTIAQARAGQMNEVFAVEGYVTSGTTNPDTTFFDTIYIQDETAGIDIFPYAETGLEIGTKVRITGFVAQYQGDMELKVISSKILDDEPYVWEPKVVDTKTAMDYAALGGSLLKTTGKVTRVAVGADGNIEEFWIADDTGEEAAIFIDGYIKSGTTGDEGKAALNDFVKVGAEVSAAGVLYMHPEGDSETSVPVFRVRNCDDIVLVKEAPEVETGSGSSSGSGSESGSGSGSGSSSGSGSESGSDSSDNSTGASDSGSSAGGNSGSGTSAQTPVQRVLGAVKQAVESVVNTVAERVNNFVAGISGDNDQQATVETPDQSTDDQTSFEQTDDNKPATIVEEATPTTDRPESGARRAARTVAATVVVVSALGLAAIGLRRLLLMLHVFR